MKDTKKIRKKIPMTVVWTLCLSFSADLLSSFACATRKKMCAAIEIERCSKHTKATDGAPGNQL